MGSFGAGSSKISPVNTSLLELSQGIAGFFGLGHGFAMCILKTLSYLASILC